MKSIVRVMNFFAKMYQLFSWVMILLLFIAFVALMVGLMNPHEPSLQGIINLKYQGPYTIYLLTAFALDALIFKGFGKFFEAKRINAPAAAQRSALTPIPKYLVASYFLGFISKLNLIPNSNAKSVDLLISKNEAAFNILNSILPDFSGAIGLILALVIYLFVKNLDIQEQLSAETNVLKQEADLVI